MSEQFSEGTPVYDANGVQVGTLSKHDLLGNNLILYKSTSFQRDIQVPISTVQRSNARGIYLSVSEAELQHERYSIPSATAESAGDGLISKGTDVIEQSPNTVTQGVSVIEQTPNTYTKGTDVIEQSPDTYPKGADTIESNAEGPLSGEV